MINWSGLCNCFSEAYSKKRASGIKYQRLVHTTVEQQNAVSSIGSEQNDRKT